MLIIYLGNIVSGLGLGGTGGFKFSQDVLDTRGGIVGVGGLRVVAQRGTPESTFTGSLAPAASAVYLILVYSLPSWILFYNIKLN